MRSTLRRRLRRWRGLRHARPRNGLRLPGTAAVLTRAPSAALLAALSALAFPAAGFAAPSWAPPRELSGAGSAPLGLSATAGLGPAGAVVLWHSEDGVQAVARAAGHNFGTPRVIRGSKLSMPDLRPRLAFDAKGAALAVWSYFEPHPRFVEDGYAVDYTFGLRVAARGANGAFGRAQALTDKLDADPSADVAIDPSGTAIVIWTDEAGIHASARPVGKRRFGRAQVISQTQADPQVTVGGESGSATAAWAGSSHGSSWVGASTSKSNAFASPTALPIPGLGKAKPVIGVDGRSAVTAAWAATDGRVMAATCKASGSCGRAHALSKSGEKAADPRVAVAADGTAVVAWRTPEGIAASLRRGHRAFGSAGTLAKLGDGQSAKDLAVAVGPKGDAAALWLIHSDKGDQVHAALRHGATARFAKASELTGVVAGANWSNPEVVLDDHGNALAVWGAMIDGHPSIQAAAYDAG